MKKKLLWSAALSLLLTGFPARSQNYFDMAREKPSTYAGMVHKLDSVFNNNDSLKTKKGTGYKDYMRWKWMMENRVDAQGSLAKYQRAYENYVAERSAPPIESTSGEGGTLPATWCNANYRANWKALGFDQRPVGSVGPGLSNGMGWMSCVWTDPNNVNLMYAGSNNGGLWKTTSGGSSWTNITGDQIMGMGVTSLAVNTSSSNIILIGASFGDGFRGASGVWRTTNGGTNWVRSNVNGSPKNWHISKIIYHPLNNSIVYAIARDWVAWDDFILISTDGGQNFNDVIHGIRNSGIQDNVDYNWQDIDVHLDNANNATIWVGGDVSIKSTDGGLNFTAIPYSFSYSTGTTQVISTNIAVTRQSTARNYLYRTYEARNWVYNPVTTNYDLVDLDIIIEKSTDYGLTWTVKKNDGNPYEHGVGSRKGVLEISKLNANILYIGRDYFGYWEDTVNTMRGSLMTNIHVDFRGLSTVVLPNGEEWLYTANDGGMFKAKFQAPATWAWTDISGQGLMIQQVYRSALASDGSRFTSGHQDLSTMNYAFPTNGQYQNGIWSSLTVTGGDGGTSVLDKDYNGALIFTANSSVVRYSPTAGTQYLGNGNYIEQPMEYSEQTKNLFTGLRNPANSNKFELYKFSNPFTTLSSTILTSVASDDPIIAIAVSPDEQTIYYAIKRKALGGVNAFYKTTDGGSTWSVIGPASGLSSLTQTTITDIEMNPADPNEIWVSFGFFDGSPSTGRVFHTTDGGATWTDISLGMATNIPVNRLALDKSTAGSIQMLYAATDVGVFYRNTVSGGWQPFSEFLPLVIVNDLNIDKANGKLIASTFGRGVWYTDLPCCDFSLSEQVVSTNTTWSTFDRSLYSNIRVSPGATLTITNCIVYINKGVKIIVEAGAKLIIDNARLTNNCGLNNTWHGIEVWGNPLAVHTFPNQGMVDIKNGAIIENAYNAVYSGDFSGPSRNGGIIRAANSYFYNNRFSINIPEYTTGNNTSSVMGCTFDCFKALHNGQGVFHHVAVVGTNGVRILGNTFRNSAPAAAYVNNYRGNGVQGVNAGFTVDRLDDPFTSGYPCDFPDGPQNVFEGLSCGVNIYDYVSNPSREIKVLGSRFKNCQIGVSVYGDGIKKIYMNEFIWDNQLIVDVPSSLTPAQAVCGVKCDQASQLLIDNNTFNFLSNFSYGKGVGVFVNQSVKPGYGSYIYRNSFIRSSPFSTTMYATYIDGNNPDLKIECNTYNGFSYDWYILTQAPEVLPNQGAPGQGTNQFSNCPGGSTLVNIYSTYSFTVFPYQASPTPLCLSGPGTVNVVSSSNAAPCNQTGQCAIRTNGTVLPGAANPDIIIGPGMQRSGINNGTQHQHDLDTIPFGANDGKIVNNTIAVEPNPAVDVIMLKYELANPAAPHQVTVINALGQVVYTAQLATDGKQLSIPAQRWSAGIYFVKVTQGDQILFNAKVALDH